MKRHSAAAIFVGLLLLTTTVYSFPTPNSDASNLTAINPGAAVVANVSMAPVEVAITTTTIKPLLSDPFFDDFCNSLCTATAMDRENRTLSEQEAAFLRLDLEQFKRELRENDDIVIPDVGVRNTSTTIDMLCDCEALLKKATEIPLEVVTTDAPKKNKEERDTWVVVSLFAIIGLLSVLVVAALGLLAYQIYRSCSRGRKHTFRVRKQGVDPSTIVVTKPSKKNTAAVVQPTHEVAVPANKEVAVPASKEVAVPANKEVAPQNVV